MISKKSLQVVILSYNRSKSLMAQINEFERLDYFCNPQIDFVIQDNNSNDETEKVVETLKKLGITVRRFKENIGYARSYIKAHELCDYDYLWIVGDDLPSIDARSLLGYIDGFRHDLIYFVFRGMTNSLPVLPRKSFLNDSFVDIDVNKVLSVVSNFTCLIGGFVSGVIWNQNLIKGVISRYIHVLSNEVLSSYSPQVLIVPLFMMESDGSHNKKDYQIRVYRESITKGTYALPQCDVNKNNVLAEFRNYRLHSIFKIFKSDYGIDLFIRAIIWVHMTYVICDFYGSRNSIKQVAQYHQYSMAYHFSIFYKLSNYKIAMILLVTALRRYLFIDYSHGEYSRLDIGVLIYRLFCCQLKGIKIKKLFFFDEKNCKTGVNA